MSLAKLEKKLNTINTTKMKPILERMARTFNKTKSIKSIDLNIITISIYGKDYYSF